jgi:hypothetical protein
VTTLAELVALYEDPRPVLEQWRGRVVGYLGRDVPRPLIAAAGLLPYRVRGELIDGVDFLLISHESDRLVRLFTALRALGTVPELWFVDLLHLPTETTAEYNRARLDELRTVLERWSGHPLAEEVDDPNPALLSRLTGLRRSGRLRGSDALAVIGAGETLPAAEYTRLLERLLDEEHEPVPADRRAYVTGSEPSRELYLDLEHDGVHVIGEDRQRIHGTNEWAAHTARAAKTAGADLVLVWIAPGDEALTWGLPALRDALDVELVVRR